MNHLAHLTRQLTRSDLFLDDDLVVVPEPPLKPAAVDALPPHVLSRRRMLELTAPESSSASSSASASSTPLSSLPATLTVTELEEKLSRALLACRAALEESEDGSDLSSSDDSSDLDDSDEDAEMDESDDIRDGEDASSDDDDDDMESDDEPTIKPDDTYHRRMRRVCAWRDTIVEREASAAPLVSSPCPSVLSRKRKADDASDADCDLQTCSKRIRVACPVHACTACGWTFPNVLALQEHGTPSNPSEACRAAVAYQLEA